MPRAKIAMKNTPLLSTPSLQSSDVVSAVLRNENKVAAQLKEPVKYSLVQPKVVTYKQGIDLTEFTLPLIALFVMACFGVTVVLNAHKHEVSAHVAKTENASANLSVVSTQQTAQAQITAPKTPTAPVNTAHTKQELYSILNKE